jgi:N-acetylornithine carbamoyltransferase
MHDRFITTESLSPEELGSILELAQRGKANSWAHYRDALSGKVIGLLFLNSSLRTRTSFQSGIARLGGNTIVLNASGELYPVEYTAGATMNGTTVEHVKDAAGALSRYVDLLCVRSFAHPVPGTPWEEERRDSIIHSYAEYATVPLINMESVMWHPCQALADAVTIRERLGDPRGKRFVFTWADHPRALCTAVCNSSVVMAAQLGMQVTLACPEGYELDSEVMERVGSLCRSVGTRFEVEHSQREAFRDAEIVYAKSWSPPRFAGRPNDDLEHRKTFGSWTVTEELMSLTRNAAFMHCLPVRRNVEVVDQVIDGRGSVVLDQAENRMHAQNALLLSLLGAA